jgi:hypothetical protein
MSLEPAKNHRVSNLIMLVLITLGGAKDLKSYSERAQGNKSEMFRFAQHDKPQLIGNRQPRATCKIPSVTINSGFSF